MIRRSDLRQRVEICPIIGERQPKIANFRRLTWNFIKLTRAPFLLGGFLLYALGAAVAARMGFVINWGYYGLGQVVVTSIQLMAHYLNEYYDVEVDRLAADNRTWFSGGSGILSAGRIAPSTALAAARICAAIAILAGVLASFHSAWMIPVVLLAIVGSWFYSAPPRPLMSSGWGELTTSLIVALLVPMAGYCMQGGFPPAEAWLLSFPLVLVHAAMLISFEFPDHTADQSVGKKTLTVRFGLRSAAWFVDALIASAALFVAICALFSKYVGVWMGWAFAAAVWQMVSIHRVIQTPTRSFYRILTAGGLGLFALASLLALAGIIFMA